MTELHEAASTGDLLALQNVLKAGANPNEPDTHWGMRTALHVACSSGHKKIVYILLQEGSDINAVTDIGWTPAHFACEGGNADCLRTLLSFGGCNVLAVDQYGDTPRKIAQVYNHLQCIEVIDEHLRKTNT